VPIACTRQEVRCHCRLQRHVEEPSANAAEWIGDYMKGVYVPTAWDVNRLHELSSAIARLRDAVRRRPESARCAQLAGRRERAVGDIQKTRIRDFEKLIVFLNQLHKVLWEMYYNGERPALRPMPYSVRSLAAKKLKDLRDGPTHEHIVVETRMCMSLITQAARALPRGSRLALRWG
jgi:hypothetical protein